MLTNTERFPLMKHERDPNSFPLDERGLMIIAVLG